jgi:DNA-directed RNA polymerase subunit RPC12/RpoP
MDILEYKCNICKKKYASYNSLWLHKYKYHSSGKPQNTHFITSKTSKLPQSISEKQNLHCTHCNKLLSRLDNLKRHEKTCKMNQFEFKNKDEIIELKLKTLQDTLEIKHKQEMEQFKNDLLKSLKIDKKELNKINNQLNLNQQNNINNNNNYFQLGYENF